MCIIVIQPSGHRFDDYAIFDFYDHNPHGFGFMWADGKGLHTLKDVPKSPEQAIDWYNKYASGKAGVLHYRYATHGPVSKEMAHPFMVAKNLAVVHNGVLGDYGSAEESDTAEFVRTVLTPSFAPDPKRLHDPKTAKWLEGQVAGSSLVFLDKAGLVTRFGSKGVEYGGCWYSNTYAWTLPRDLFDEEEFDELGDEDMSEEEFSEFMRELDFEE